MKRLLIDSSSILKSCLYAAINTDSVKLVLFEEKQVKVGDSREAYFIFLSSFEKTLATLGLVPSQAILIKDGKNAKAFRRKFLPEYSVRKPGPPEFIEEFVKLQDMVEETLLKYGGLSVSKEGIEADDIINALSSCIDSVIWSTDKDLLACPGDFFHNGTLNPNKFCGIAKKHIQVYKALVGDKSDRISGVPNLGEKTFIDLVSKYGDEALEDILQMLEEECLEELEPHTKDFKGFQKILDNKEAAYNSFKCAKFYHPGFTGLQYKMLNPSGNGDLPQWEPKSELITKNKLTSEFIAQLKRELKEAHVTALDIETSMTTEGLAWSEANKSKNKKTGPLDVFGAVLAGFSINTGSNNHITYYFPVDHKSTDNITLEQAEDILNLLPNDKPCLVHNAIYELPVLRNHFALAFDRGYLPEMTYDTRIMAGYVDENSPYGLKDRSKSLMDYDQVHFEDLMGDDGVLNKQMREMTGEEVLSYGNDDTICTSALYRHAEVVMKYEGTWDSYIKVDQPVQFIHAESFLTGVKFDLDMIKDLQAHNNIVYKETLCNIEEFLQDYEWEVSTAVEREQVRITVDNLEEMKALAKQQPEYTTTKGRWPGCVFEPAKELLPVEIKRLFLLYSGRELKTAVRKIEKIVDKVREEGEAEFADALESGLDSLNTLTEYSFTPKPELNLRSPKQLSYLLYEALGYPVRIRNKLTDKQRGEGRAEGNPASDDTALKHAIMYDARSEAERLLLHNILGAKSCLTEDSLFFTPYQSMPHWKDGYVHPQPGQAMATSGRATPSGPNVSQVSKISLIRRAYVPLEDDHVWISFDCESQELAHAAWHSQDENMLSCFMGDRRDIHSITGVGIWAVDHDPLDYEAFMKIRKDDTHPLHNEVVKVRNKKAKPTNFLSQYGGTAGTLAEGLLITESEAQAMLDAKEAMFPGVKVWQDKLTDQHIKLGYAVEPMGRRKHLVLDGTWRDKHELRSALNFVIQGGAASQIKLILGRIWKEKILEKFEAYFLFPVHDEINFSVKKSQALEFIKEVHPIMTMPYADFGIEIRSSIEIGPNFGELVEIGSSIDEAKIMEVLERI